MGIFLTNESAQDSGTLFNLLIPFFIIFLIMWLLVIRPQRKEQKQRQEMLQNIKKGDVVVTSGGIVGKIIKLKDDRVEIESNETKLTFLRSAVVAVVSPKEEKEIAK